MVSGFPHAGRISTTSCGVIVHRQAWIHRSGSRFGSAIAFALYWSRFFSARSSQCSSSHRSYSSGGHVPASSGAHGHRLMTQWYWSKSVQSTRFSSTRRCRSSNPVVLVAEARIPSVGTRMRPAFRIDPARPRPQRRRIRIRTRHALALHFAHHPPVCGRNRVPPVGVAVVGDGLPACRRP